MGKRASDLDRVKTLYEGKGERSDPFWSHENWGPLIPEIQFGEGQFRDCVIESLRERGWGTTDMAALSVIELGCGWGRNLHLFVEVGIPAKRIAGIDLIERFVAFGKAQNPAFDLKVGDASRTGLAAGAFDIVLLHTVLSSLLDREIQASLLREARRLVRDRGLVLVFDIADHYPAGQTEVSGKQLAFIQPLPMRELREMAADAGLAVASRRKSGLMPRLRKLAFRGLSATLAARLGGSLAPPRDFALRRAMATLLSHLPRAHSHDFVVLVPVASGTDADK